MVSVVGVVGVVGVVSVVGVARGLVRVLIHTVLESLTLHLRHLLSHISVSHS